MFDTVILNVPIFGPLLRKFNAARFCRTLAYLLSAGVPIVKALEIVSTVLGSVLFQEAAREASVEIQKGRQLNEVLVHYPKIFQSIVVQMITVGEETGKVPYMLIQIARFFEEDVENTTRNMSSVIEPLLMIIIGAAVGFFALAMLQPIYGGLNNF